MLYFIVLVLHFSTETVLLPSNYYWDVPDYLAALIIDLLLCSHFQSWSDDGDDVWLFEKVVIATIISYYVISCLSNILKLLSGTRCVNNC